MATTTDIYEHRASVKERFPDKEDGLELVEAIFDLYSISRSGELQFYDSSMRNKLVIPHELNSRDQHQVLRKYVSSVKKYGVIQGVRGEPWCVLSDGNKPPWRMLSWGTLSRAVYAAYEEDETNPKVLKSITTGLRNAIVLHCRTPTDCLVYLRDFHNRWHGGSSMTFTDTIAETINLDKAWLGYAKSKGWQVRTCGAGQNSWAARQWAFISSQSPEKYSSANVFLHAKALATWLSKSGLMQDLRSYCGSCVFFDEPRLSNSNVIHLLHSWGLILQQYRQIDNSSKRLLFLEGLAFMMPCTAMEPHPDMTCSGREVPWLFETVDMDLMKLVHTPMATSQIYTRAANGGNGKGNGKNKRKATESDSPNGDEEGGGEGGSRSNKKGKGKGVAKSTKRKGSQKGGSGTGHEEKSERTAAWQSILGSTTNPITSQNESESNAEMPVLEATEDSDMNASDAVNPDAAFAAKVFAGPEDGAARQVLWLDDMVSSCLRVVDFEFGKDECGVHRLPKGLSEAMVSRVISFFFSSSLEFAWKKSLTLSGKTLKQWTQVRPALQELIRNAFIEMKTGTATTASGEGSGSSLSAAAMVLGTNTNQAIVSKLLNACKQDESEVAPEVKECPAPEEQAKNGNAKDSAVPGAAAKSADKTAEVEMTHKSLTEVLGFVPSDASMLSHIASGNLDASPVGGANVFEPTTITLPDHVPFDFVAIREIMTELQAAIFRWAYSYESRKHMEDIYVDIPKPSPAVLCRFPCELTKEQDFCLPLAGTVSLTPSNHSLPLCVVSKEMAPAARSTEGVSWDAEESELKVVIYVTGDSHKCIGGDQFVPAWSVKSVSKDPFLALGPIRLDVRKPESWMPRKNIVQKDQKKKDQNRQKDQTPKKDQAVEISDDSPEKTTEVPNATKDGQVAKVASQVLDVDDDAEEEETLSIQAPCLMPTHPFGDLKQAGDNIPFAELTRGSFREGTGSSSHIRQLGQVMDKLGFGALRANLIQV